MFQLCSPVIKLQSKAFVHRRPQPHRMLIYLVGGPTTIELTAGATQNHRNDQ